MSIRLFLLLCVAIASWAQPLRADSLPSAKPKAVGLSAQRLERLSNGMQTYVDQQKLAGLVTMIARRGKVAHFKAFGMMEIEAGKPMQLDTIFRIYSMTKPITSVAVLMLYERGAFLLNDPIAKFIPELAGLKVLGNPAGPLDRTVALQREITVRDLLTHTSGFTYPFMTPGPIAEAYEKPELDTNNSQSDLQTWIEQLAKLPLVYQPGTRWNYGVSTDILGHLVAVVSGVPFDDFLRENIFEPLGMVDTDFHVPAAKLDRFAANYGPAEGGGLKVIDAPATSRYTLPPSLLSGGGGLVSTASDYLRFAQMLLNGGELDGVRILGSKTVELMTMNHLTEQELQADFLEQWFRGWGFGLGVSVITDLAQTNLAGSVGEYGWNGAASTTFWVDPKEELIAIQMTQFMPAFQYPLPSELRALVYATIVD
jgi:CubicO group peptidase (beta-lactamase class C family)